MLAFKHFKHMFKLLETVGNVEIDTLSGYGLEFKHVTQMLKLFKLDGNVQKCTLSCRFELQVHPYTNNSTNRVQQVETRAPSSYAQHSAARFSIQRAPSPRDARIKGAICVAGSPNEGPPR